ncbi:4-hydroxy-tetrahydrodipicolinate reductase [bacterium]|nr:4-hydroxy-tetrahydrodipicolinate reductase [bacterium]
MIRVCLFGAGGRMGRAVLEALATESDIEVVDAVDTPNQAGNLAGDHMLVADGESAGTSADVWVDVSLREAAIKHSKRAATLNIPILIGATGFSETEIETLNSLNTAVIYAPNLSPGVNLLFSLMPHMRNILGKGYDVAVHEIHHHHKLDAPSGTAKRLAEGISLEGENVQITSLRLGENVGEHKIYFTSEGEEIQITHRAHSRLAFAAGVAPAVRFLHGKKSGNYSMSDVLGLNWQKS